MFNVGILKNCIFLLAEFGGKKKKVWDQPLEGLGDVLKLFKYSIVKVPGLET